MNLEKDKRKHERMQDGVWVQWDETTRVKVRSWTSRSYQRARQEFEDKVRRDKGYLPDKDLTGEETTGIAKDAVAAAGIVAVESCSAPGAEDWSPALTEEGKRREWVEMDHIFMKIASLMSNEKNFEEAYLEVLRKNS